jgi:hypothetical protein
MSNNRIGSDAAVVALVEYLQERLEGQPPHALPALLGVAKQVLAIACLHNIDPWSFAELIDKAERDFSISDCQ